MNWDLMKPWLAQGARDFLRTVGMGLAAHGVIKDGAGVESFIGAGMTLAGLFWGWFTTGGAQQMAAALKKLTGTITHKDAVTAAQVLPPAAAVDTASKAAVVKSVTTVLLIAFALSLFLAAPPAMAQARKPLLTGDVVQDIKNASGKPASSSGTASTSSIDDALSAFNTKVQQITKDLVDRAIADVTAAQTDAQNHNDQISKPCWDANLVLLKSLPTQWENPPTFPVGLALGIQIQRDLLNSITGNDVTSLKVACAALWGDQLKIVTELGGLLGIKIATGGLL